MVDGVKRVVERILGRRKLKSSYEYEVQWVGCGPDKNTWHPRDDLVQVRLLFSLLVPKVYGVWGSVWVLLPWAAVDLCRACVVVHPVADALHACMGHIWGCPGPVGFSCA